MVACHAALEAVTAGTALDTHTSFTKNKKLSVPPFVMKVLSQAAASEQFSTAAAEAVSAATSSGASSSDKLV